MSLYHAQFDGESYYIEARNFHGAIDTWKRHVAKAWGQNFDGTEAPESVAGMRAVIAKLKKKDTGKFFEYDGGSIPW